MPQSRGPADLKNRQRSFHPDFIKDVDVLSICNMIVMFVAMDSNLLFDKKLVPWAHFQFDRPANPSSNCTRLGMIWMWAMTPTWSPRLEWTPHSVGSRRHEGYFCQAWCTMAGWVPANTAKVDRGECCCLSSLLRIGSSLKKVTNSMAGQRWPDWPGFLKGNIISRHIKATIQQQEFEWICEIATRCSWNLGMQRPLPL